MTQLIGNCITSLDAIVLISDRFEEQVAFYKDILKLPLMSKGADYAFFSCGKQKFAVFDRSHHPQGTKRLGAAKHGLSHFEFGISGRDKEAMFAQLESAGALAYGENFQDIDGNLFHFNVNET